MIGDAGRFFDPRRADEMAGVLRALVEDDALRRRLGEAGRRRSQGFSWSAAADRTLDVLEGAARGRPA